MLWTMSVTIQCRWQYCSSSGDSAMTFGGGGSLCQKYVFVNLPFVGAGYALAAREELPAMLTIMPMKKTDASRKKTIRTDWLYCHTTKK